MTEREPVEGDLPEELQPDERRSAERYIPLLRAAKIVTRDGRELPCIMRDVSQTGLSVKLFGPIPESAGYTVVMPNGRTLDVGRVWLREDAAGFAFDHPADVMELVRGAGPYPKRQIRIDVTWPGKLWSRGVEYEATVLNISQSGALLQCSTRLALGQRMQLTTPLTGAIDVTLKWRSDEGFGVAFDRLFKFDELARLMVGPGRAGARPS